MMITLRIKRKYMDAILAGHKTVEYRDHKDYYRSLLNKTGITHLRLHYQSDRKAIAEVRRIELIPRPSHLVAVTTPYVYAIHLGKAWEESAA